MKEHVIALHLQWKGCERLVAALACTHLKINDLLISDLGFFARFLQTLLGFLSIDACACLKGKMPQRFDQLGFLTTSFS